MSWKAFLKSKLLLLSVAVTWLLLIVLMSPLQIPLAEWGIWQSREVQQLNTWKLL